MEIQGIILKSMEYKEADVLISVLCLDGKYSVVCKGANKLTSKNGASLFPYSYVNLQLNDTTTKSMYSLRSAETLNLFHGMRDDIIKMTIASCMSEYCDYFANDGSNELYPLLTDSLNALQYTEKSVILLLVFLANLVHIFGIEPYVDGCVMCDSSEGICCVSINDGGFICANCLDETHTKKEREFLYLFRIIHKAKIENVEKINSDDQTILKVLSFMFGFIEEHSAYYSKGKELLLSLLHS